MPGTSGTGCRGCCAAPLRSSRFPKATRNDILSHCRVKEEKVRVITEGFDRDSFRPGYDLSVLRKHQLHPKSYILAVGSPNPRKNLNRLVDAFCSIKDRVPHDLVLAGPFPDADREFLLRRAELQGGERG